MPGKPRYTAAQVGAALTASKGLVYLAAKRLKCDPDTIYNYCKRHPSVQAIRDAMRGQMVDLAEQKLWESIQNGEAWGITLCLKTIGKDRGYIERQELSGNDGNAILLRAVYDQSPAPPELPAPAPRAVEEGVNGHRRRLPE